MTARLHVITSDEVLGRRSFPDHAAAILDAGGARVVLHIRGHGTGPAALMERAEPLARRAGETGAQVLVNDRIDVALASRATGAQLGRRSVPVSAARRLLPDAVIGYSAHGIDEVRQAESEGADFVILGPVWPTATHPGQEGAGPGLIEVAAARTPMDIIAIGGVTPARMHAIADAAGSGVAVLSGIWSAKDPVAAAGEYLLALDAWSS